ncbi:hypothetical protein CJF31_00003666 [Rutstroemia sp. NJR-2017a BVV2]|nr:hypothetical protein CJF31_00003666 [Rutstroemia sp. NJR-2017a BVV2]
MFFSPFISTLLPMLATSTQLNTPQSQQPSIFILGDHASHTAALGIALQTLGYTHTVLNSSFPELSTHTYTELPTASIPNDLMIQYPNSKFILPVTSSPKPDSQLGRRPCANSWLGLLAAWKPDSKPIVSDDEEKNAQHEQLRRSLERGRLLEIALDERESHRGEKWLMLCDFLDLGYSVVERLKLKEFPTVREQRTASWGGLGEKMAWGAGLMVQRSA